MGNGTEFVGDLAEGAEGVDAEGCADPDEVATTPRVEIEVDTTPGIEIEVDTTPGTDLVER